MFTLTVYNKCGQAMQPINFKKAKDAFLPSSMLHYDMVQYYHILLYILFRQIYIMQTSLTARCHMSLLALVRACSAGRRGNVRAHGLVGTSATFCGVRPVLDTSAAASDQMWHVWRQMRAADLCIFKRLRSSEDLRQPVRMTAVPSAIYLFMYVSWKMFISVLFITFEITFPVYHPCCAYHDANHLSITHVTDTFFFSQSVIIAPWSSVSMILAQGWSNGKWQ